MKNPVPAMRRRVFIKTAAFMVAAAWAGQGQGAPVNGFRYPFFAFCFDTHDARKRTLQQQAELLKELGFDGAGHLWLDGVKERLETLESAGLKLFQIYLRGSIAPGQPAYDARLKEVLPLLKGKGTTLALLIVGVPPSSAQGREPALKLAGEIADLAHPFGVKVALYHHRGDWMERVEDALWVVEKARRPNLGVMFNLCHWMAVDDEKNLMPLIKSAMPHLLAVSISGTDSPAEIKAGTGKWIQPLDKGAWNVQEFARQLKQEGYRGPVGLQCYGLGGDAREHLQRSISQWQRWNL